ncbi:MAG: VWA domain-containing protein, partial [Planctomycetota bacterium]|nr:VWA domain-containing protein [Planctomycetota bacterium]
RALALEALGGMDGPAVGLMLTRPSPTEHWVEACARALALGKQGGTGAVAPLLDLLDQAELAPRVHAREALVQLTRQDLPAQAEPWRAWWAGQAGRLPAGEAPTSEGPRYATPEPLHVPHYYGVPIPRKGSRVVFCVDASQSMYGSGIESARRELRKTLMDLPSSHEFEVILFHERVMPWRERLVRAHPVQKLLAIRYLESIDPTSYTNLYDAVDMAFGHAGRGSRPRDPAVKLDAVFLLSDGAPNRGRHRAHARVIDGIKAMSRREIPVHTIGAGEEVFPLLMAIARETGGEFVDAFE